MKLAGATVRDIVRSEAYRVVDDMALLFRPPMERSSELYRTTALDRSAFVMALIWSAAGGFSVACVLLYALVYRTLLARLDVEIKNTRMLLLLVPLQVVQQVPAIKAFIRDQKDVLAEA